MPAIHVNGEQREIDTGTTIAALLERLELPRDGIAVEVNRTIVPRRRHGETVLQPGDEVEIVTFVGGG